MNARRVSQSGFTLIETLIVLAISGLVLTAFAAIASTILRVPIRTQSETAATRQLQNATLIVTEDANAAREFTAGTGTDYGTFSWFDLGGTSPVAVAARYYWSDQQMLRVFTYDGEQSNPQVVAQPILEQSDVSFAYTPPEWIYDALTRAWTYTEGKVLVAFTATSDGGAGFPDTVISATLSAGLRPQADRPVPLPGRLPPPVPPANQVSFNPASVSLITGSLQGGAASSLSFDDTTYYTVRGSGSPRVVEWEATSEVIDYSTITDISIEFTGQVSSSGVSQSFSVYDPAAHGPSGYDTSPDNTAVYSVSNTDQTVAFSLNADDVAYIDSLQSKVIKVRLKATLPGLFDLRSDRLVFKVAGTPAPTFSRDYFVDTDPSLETGTLQSGEFSSMGADDTDYYDVRNSGNTVQWQAVSEAISLDTVSSIEVRFIGRSTGGAPPVKFFIFNPANGGDGFPVTPGATTTYATNNIDYTTSFFLSESDVSYVNSLFPKEVKLRVAATASGGGWRLQADRLVFRVKP